MRLLLVDDDPGLRRPMTMLLKEAGHEVVAEPDGEAGLNRAQSEEFDIILCDVNMPKLDGLTFLRRYRAEGGPALLIMMSAFGNEDDAFAAMREGAYDYIRKPFVIEEVLATLRKATERETLRQEVVSLRATLRGQGPGQRIVGDTPNMRRLIELAGWAALRDEPVLLVGEPGSGREHIARAIHRQGPRAEGPFVKIACGALEPAQLELELLGSESGEGGPEAARGGIVYLDAVDRLVPALQPLVVAALRDGRFPRAEGGRVPRALEVRWMASASRRLEDLVATGEFLPELAERLNGVVFDLPPLRERRDDIPALIAHFAQRTSVDTGRPVSLAPTTLGVLTSCPWPGNVRELRLAIERAAKLSTTGRLEPADFRPEIDRGASAGATEFALEPQVQAVERDAIMRALRMAGGNRREAASLLGVSLRTLFYKLNRYHLD